MRVLNLNRSVIAPLSSAIITVLIAGLVVAGVDSVDRNKVDPGTARVLSSGPEGLRVLCVGGVPGGVYDPPGWSSSGE